MWNAPAQIPDKIAKHLRRDTRRVIRLNSFVIEEMLRSAHNSRRAASHKSEIKPAALEKRTLKRARALEAAALKRLRATRARETRDKQWTA